MCTPLVRYLSLAVLGITLLLSACAGRSGPPTRNTTPETPRRLKRLTVAERLELLRRAQVWQAIETASLNVLDGPEVPPDRRIGDQLTCKFVFPDKPLGGNTPKFDCAIQPTDIVKVKYGTDNGEVYGEVAATRLFWALGFKVDAMFPARVTCLECPGDPFAASKRDWYRGAPRGGQTRLFDPAAVERENPGAKIEVPGFEGWAWPELEQVSDPAGGAPRAHVDALKLLAVFVQHSDSKAEQQDLVCEGEVGKDVEGNETCASPWLIVRDLGTTFGKATRLNSSKMTLADWSSVTVWRPGQACVGNLPRSFTGTLENPRISEAGRQFLAERLALLSDQQLADLFRASRVERRGESTTGPDRRRQAVTVDDWVRVFKRKRDEIVNARCPS